MVRRKRQWEISPPYLLLYGTWPTENVVRVFYMYLCINTYTPAYTDTHVHACSCTWIHTYIAQLGIGSVSLSHPGFILLLKSQILSSQHSVPSAWNKFSPPLCLAQFYSFSNSSFLCKAFSDSRSPPYVLLKAHPQSILCFLLLATFHTFKYQVKFRHTIGPQYIL